MGKTIALFSGQGAQHPGMGRALYEQYAEVRSIYDCTSEIFGFDVARTSFEGTPEQLMQTEAAQSAIFTLSVSAWTAAMQHMRMPGAVAGHSLGEYAALYCAGACSLEDMLRLLRARAQGMAEAAKANPGAMYAVVGAEAAAIDAACSMAGEQVWPVNFNIPSQTVIAGSLEDTAAAAAVLEGQGAKVVRLEVEGAFHAPLMQPAADRLREAAQQCAFSPLKLDFYSNLTGGRLEIEDYPDYLVRHMLSPVRFVEQMQAVTDDGFDICIEFGPKRVVTLAKKNNRAFSVCHVEDPATLQKALELAGER